MKFLPRLQCHECKDVPGHSSPKKRRYSCMEGSHVLCEDHKAKCPCGALVAKNPCPTIAILLEDLPLMCQNYKNGCSEIKLRSDELENHQGKCIFRQVFCPGWDCKDLFSSKQVMIKDFNDHLTTFHKNNYHVEAGNMVYGKENQMLYDFYCKYFHNALL